MWPCCTNLKEKSKGLLQLVSTSNYPTTHEPTRTNKDVGSKTLKIKVKHNFTITKPNYYQTKPNQTKTNSTQLNSTHLNSTQPNQKPQPNPNLNQIQISTKSRPQTNPTKLNSCLGQPNQTKLNLT